ncbi:MAG: type I-C CRISPR-associated protein Cas5c [Oscillospiraceae bacterium]
MKNEITFELSGKYALFTDPISKIGGEKSSLPIPTYQALKGVCESIYWKPTIIWYVDKLVVLHSIKTEAKGIRPLKYSGGNDLAYYTYLADPKYIVTAHFEFNENRPDLIFDRNEHKHYFIAKRSLEKGGRRDVFLGTRECPAYVEPCQFSNDNSVYKNTPELDFGFMYHSTAYPDENGSNQLTAKFWSPVMKNGIIEFCRPENCISQRFIKDSKTKAFGEGNFSGTSETQILDGYEEGDNCELD